MIQKESCVKCDFNQFQEMCVASYLLCGEVDRLVPEESLLLLLDFEPCDFDLLRLTDLELDCDFFKPLLRLPGDAAADLETTSLPASLMSLLLLISFGSLTIMGFNTLAPPLLPLGPDAEMEGVVAELTVEATSPSASDCERNASRLLVDVPCRPNEPFL